MSTKFSMTRDINGYNGFGLMFADDKYSTTLASGVAQTLTIPSNASKWLAIFSYEPGGEVWVANNATAALPGGTMAAATSEMNPTARQVKAGDILSFITPDTTLYIGITLYILE
jgi:hypothetical protein